MVMGLRREHIVFFYKDWIEVRKRVAKQDKKLWEWIFFFGLLDNPGILDSLDYTILIGGSSIFLK